MLINSSNPRRFTTNPFNFQSGRSFLMISVSAPKSGRALTRSVCEYSRDEIILLGKIIYFVHLGTSDSSRYAGPTPPPRKTCTVHESMYRLIPVEQEGVGGITTICVFQRILGSHTGERSSQGWLVLKGGHEYEDLSIYLRSRSNFRSFLYGDRQRCLFTRYFYIYIVIVNK